MLSNNGYVYAHLRICVTIFSNSLIILTGFKFAELHTLTLATRSYALLLWLQLSGPSEKPWV